MNNTPLAQDIYKAILASVQAEPERRRRFVWSYQNDRLSLTVRIYYSNRNDFQYVMYQTDGTSVHKYVETEENYAHVGTFHCDDAEAALRASFAEADAAAYQQLCLKQNAASSMKSLIKSVAADMRASIQDDPGGLGTWYVNEYGNVRVTTRYSRNPDKCYNGGDYHEYAVYSPDAYGRGIWRRENTSSDFGCDENPVLFPVNVPLEKLMEAATRYMWRTAAPMNDHMY